MKNFIFLLLFMVVATVTTYPIDAGPDIGKTEISVDENFDLFVDVITDQAIVYQNSPGENETTSELKTLPGFAELSIESKSIYRKHVESKEYAPFNSLPYSDWQYGMRIPPNYRYC